MKVVFFEDKDNGKLLVESEGVGYSPNLAPNKDYKAISKQYCIDAGDNDILNTLLLKVDNVYRVDIDGEQNRCKIISISKDLIIIEYV